MSSQRSRLAADWQPSPEEEAAAITRSEDDLARLYRGDFDVPAEEEIDPRWAVGGKSHQYFPRFEDDEEERLVQESGLDRKEWIDEDGIPLRDAEAVMQEREDVVVRPGGGGSKRRDNPIKPWKPTRVIAVDREKQLVSVKIYGLTRGEREYYWAKPGSAKAVLLRYVELILQGGSIPPLQCKRGKQRLSNMEIYGLTERDVNILTIRKGFARAALVWHAHQNGGDRLKFRDKCFDDDGKNMVS